jgi:NAD kinase
MKKILVVTKHSKYEWERKKFNLSHDELVNKYKSEHANLDAILNAHDYQFKVRELLTEVIPNSHSVMMDTLDGPISGYDIVIALGGDNSFTNISHYVGDIPILGINSDPERSVGHLTSYAIKDRQSVFDLCEILDFNEFEIEEWSKLEATVNGKLITPATSEYFFGERQRNMMSRHIMIVEGLEFEIKCSGIIIAAPAGFSGWFNSVTPKYYNKDRKRTEKIAGYVNTEVYNLASQFKSHQNKPFPVFGFFKPGTEIILRSLNDGEGMVSVDSWEEYEFSRGSEARVYIGNTLKVIQPIIELTDEITEEK